MAKLSQKQFKKLAEDWMKLNGYLKGNLDYLLLETRLEEEKFQPDGFYLNRTGDKFLIYHLDKTNWFPVRRKGIIQKWVTGFDTWKYLYILMYEELLGIPSAILFYAEDENEFIFRTLKEMGEPDFKWRSNKEFRKDLEALNKKHIPFGSPEYRFEYRHIVDRLFRNTGRNKGMSVWDITKFVEGKIKFNKRLDLWKKQ